MHFFAAFNNDNNLITLYNKKKIKKMTGEIGTTNKRKGTFWFAE